MPDRFWRLVEARLQRALPPSHAASAIGDLAEDYARRRRSAGPWRAALWLVREASSLISANRVVPPPTDPRRRHFLATEIRFAIRRLRARPASSLGSAALLGAGIGLCTAAFSAVDAVLLQPAPFRDADRLVRQILGYSEPQLLDAWRTSGLFEQVEAARTATFEFRADSGPSRWSGAEVTPGVFDLLGVRPVRGRTFSRQATGTLDEVLISEAIWQSVFGGDPAAIGRRIPLDDGSAVVVGVLPAAFRFPTPTTEAWKPFVPVKGERGEGLFTIFARLKPGIPRTDAEARTKALALEMARLPRNYSGPSMPAVSDADVGVFTRRALWFLLAGAALVFVVLCANVSGLVLASLSTRRREFGLCTALGASSSRLIREAGIEHALVGVAGAAIGVWIAWWLTTLVPNVFQGHTLNPIDIDPRAIVIASSLGIAAVLVSGLVPAWLGTRADPLNAIRTSRQAGIETRTARVAATGLLVGEIALACSLLAGSVSLVRSFGNLVVADPGLDADGVIRVSVGNLDDTFGSADAMRTAMTTIEARFAAWPAISAVALSREIPPGPTSQGASVHLGAPGERPDPGAIIPSDRYRVAPEFFELYRIPIVRGGAFQAGNVGSEAVVSERLAALLWPNLDPIGRSFAVGSLPRPLRVVGVAREIRLPTIDPNLDRPEYYVPLGSESRTLFLNLRCRGTCPGEAEIRAQIENVHPNLRAGFATTGDKRFLEELRLPRATAEVAGVFAIVAVITAACGLFTMLSYAVGRRRREFGIRSALGASPADLYRLVVRNGLTLVGFGVAAGAIGGWLVAKTLSAFHYGVTPADPVTWAAVLGAIAITSLGAAWRPALEAARIDPVRLLRDEQ